MHFSRIKLENWRNFRRIEVPLQLRAFLVGANASGKSNFLDVFRFLRDLVIPGGGFQDAVERRGGVSILRSLAARHPHTDIVIEVDLSEHNQTQWRYRLVFNYNQQRRRAILKEEEIWQAGQLILHRPDAEDENDEARLTQTYLEQTFANREFRPIAEFFQSISYSHIVPQLVRDPERSLGRQADPFGGDFLERIAATSRKVQESRLKRIQQALRVAVPQLSALELYRDEKGVAHLRGRYEHWRPQGTWQTETEFSDGTLRLIGLLWALQDGNGPLLLEEPELSLHPGVVRYLPQMMQRIQRQRKQAFRQIFVSTHSVELLSGEGLAPDEMVLFQIHKEGTEVKTGAEIPEIVQELRAGLTMAEAVIPRTEPKNIYQLSLWGEE